MQPCSKVVRRGTILTVCKICFHKICNIITIIINNEVDPYNVLFISKAYLWGLSITILCCMLKLGEKVLKRCAPASPTSLGRYGSQFIRVYLSLLTLLSLLALASVCWPGGTVRIWLLVDCCMGLGHYRPLLLAKVCKDTAQMTHGGITFGLLCPLIGHFSVVHLSEIK